MGLDSDLFRLGSYGRNWDSYDGEPPSQAAMDRCRQLRFVPCSDGGIQIELHSGAISAEIVIDSGGEITCVDGGPTEPAGVAAGPQATPDQDGAR